MDSQKYNKYSRFTKDLNSFSVKAPYSNSEVCMSIHKGDVQDYNNTFRIIGASNEPSVEPYSLGGPSFSRWWVSCKSVDNKYSLQETWDIVWTGMQTSLAARQYGRIIKRLNILLKVYGV